MATVELLQAQVTALTQRMDHMASQVSSMRFMQAFCEKLESEAELQLMRLRLTESFQSHLSAEPELTTARLLHGMVETMLQLRQDCCPTSPQRHEEPPELSTRPARLRASQLLSQVTRPVAAVRTGDSPTAPTSPVRRGWDDDGTVPGAGAAAPRPRGAAALLRPEPLRTAEFGTVPSATPIVFDSLQSTLECDGLSLGRGTWAEAYRRSAPGTRRRQALKMLCSLGIVTEKELADDLTVISDEHIEECVSIAMLMLEKWPPSRGLPPVHQAKEFFQAQLEAMYRDKVPSPCNG
eukprot:s1313_g4.t1